MWVSNFPQPKAPKAEPIEHIPIADLASHHHGEASTSTPGESTYKMHHGSAADLLLFTFLSFSAPPVLSKLTYLESLFTCQRNSRESVEPDTKCSGYSNAKSIKVYGSTFTCSFQSSLWLVEMACSNPANSVSQDQHAEGTSQSLGFDQSRDLPPHIDVEFTVGRTSPRPSSRGHSVEQNVVRDRVSLTLSFWPS
jgi:hypothetical protein